MLSDCMYYEHRRIRREQLLHLPLFNLETLDYSVVTRYDKPLRQMTFIYSIKNGKNKK